MYQKSKSVEKLIELPDKIIKSPKALIGVEGATNLVKENYYIVSEYSTDAVIFNYNIIIGAFKHHVSADGKTDFFNCPGLIFDGYKFNIVNPLIKKRDIKDHIKETIKENDSIFVAGRTSNGFGAYAILSIDNAVYKELVEKLINYKSDNLDLSNLVGTFEHIIF